MKILASVEQRLFETAADDWFSRLDKKKQAEYIKLHPRSKYAKSAGQAAPSAGTKSMRLVDRIAAGDKTVLQHPGVVSKIKGAEGRTPLHKAAREFKEALNHPAVSKVKDDEG